MESYEYIETWIIILFLFELKLDLLLFFITFLFKWKKYLIYLADSLVVAVMPKPPAKHLQEEEDEDEDLVRINLLCYIIINDYSFY